MLALSMGGAHAHGKIGSALLKDNAVKSRHIANGQVKTPDIGGTAVTAGKIRAKAVKTNHIADHAVWALVAADGTLLQGSGVEAVKKTTYNDGAYVVRFNKAVTKRALSGTVSYRDFDNGSISIAHCAPGHPGGNNCFNEPGFQGSAKSVMINTDDDAGGNAARAFLVVAMPRTPSVFTLSPRVAPRGNTAGDRD